MGGVVEVIVVVEVIGVVFGDVEVVAEVIVVVFADVEVVADVEAIADGEGIVVVDIDYVLVSQAYSSLVPAQFFSSHSFILKYLASFMIRILAYIQI